MYIDELTIALYAWDLADHGVGEVLDTVQETAGCNAAYLIALMHHEKRPLWDTYYPKNPKRKFYVPEDSRVQWIPDPACYKDSRIKPLPMQADFLAGRDWLDTLSKACRERGMRPQVEVSHTPLDKERASGEFVDCVQRDIYGREITQQLCWNNEHALSYMSSLLVDLAKNHDVDMVQTCTKLFHMGEPSLHPFLGVALGGCFCASCEKKARDQGLDWDRIKKTVRYFADALTATKRTAVQPHEDFLLLQRGDTSPAMFLLEYPELYQWLRFRCDSITNYFKVISEAIHGARADIDFRWNSCWPDGENIGQVLQEIKPHVNSVRLMEYTEQWGDPALMKRKAHWVSNARRQLGENFPLISAVAIRAKATPELIHEGIRLAMKNGANSLSLAFWDGCTMEQLAAVKSGMERHEVHLRH